MSPSHYSAFSSVGRADRNVFNSLNIRTCPAKGEECRIMRHEGWAKWRMGPSVALFSVRILSSTFPTVENGQYAMKKWCHLMTHGYHSRISSDWYLHTKMTYWNRKYKQIFRQLDLVIVIMSIKHNMCGSASKCIEHADFVVSKIVQYAGMCPEQNST